MVKAKRAVPLLNRKSPTQHGQHCKPVVVDRDYCTMKLARKKAVRQRPQEGVRQTESAAHARCQSAMARMFGGPRCIM
eukprot:2553375-Rhodomonas_salina.3